MKHAADDLHDIVAFMRVVETGSYARAAERMGIAKSIVSRRVSRLEATLGARLLTRSARGAQTTEIGAAYFARAANSLAELEAAREAVAVAVTDIAGPIRLTAPLSFGVQHLAPALAEFAKAHPRVELDISFEDKAVHLVGGGFDLAIRIGTLPDSSLIARRLAPVRNAALASPDYLERRGRPAHPRDLVDHDVLIYANAGAGEQWRFRVGDAWEHVRVIPRMRADNGDMLRAAAVEGLGIVILPTFIAAPSLASGALEIVLADYPFDEGGLHAVMPPGRATTARVRALVDFLAARFGPEPSWDPCWITTRGRSTPMPALLFSRP